jgi:hypothetical protein
LIPLRLVQRLLLRAAEAKRETTSQTHNALQHLLLE